VREWERQFQEYVAARHPKISEKIRTEKQLSKETEAELKSAIAAFKQTFK
jgi:F0F1-type ATP synthase alpha subunit